MFFVLSTGVQIVYSSIISLLICVQFLLLNTNVCNTLNGLSEKPCVTSVQVIRDDKDLLPKECRGSVEKPGHVSISSYFQEVKIGTHVNSFSSAAVIMNIIKNRLSITVSSYSTKQSGNIQIWVLLSSLCSNKYQVLSNCKQGSAVMPAVNLFNR